MSEMKFSCFNSTRWESPNVGNFFEILFHVVLRSIVWMAIEAAPSARISALFACQHLGGACLVPSFTRGKSKLGSKARPVVKYSSNSVH